MGAGASMMGFGGYLATSGDCEGDSWTNPAGRCLRGLDLGFGGFGFRLKKKPKKRTLGLIFFLEGCRFIPA